MAASVWITLIRYVIGVMVARLTTVPRILMVIQIQEEVMIQVVVMVVVLSSPPLMLLTRFFVISLQIRPRGAAPTGQVVIKRGKFR